MIKTLKAALLASGMTLGLTGAAHADHIAYSLGGGGDTLVGVAFDDIAEGDAEANTTAITLNGVSLSLDAITYRPQTGEFYGYDADTGSLYTVNPATGAATLEFQSDILPDGFVSFDTNNNLDAFRFVNASGENVVYFPDDSANGPANQGRLISVELPDEAGNISAITYDTGYDETGTPTLIGNGYTNQLPVDAAMAQGDDLIQYVLDASTDTLGILNNNAGTVDFVADAGIDFDVSGGFDVFSTGDTDILYALLTVDGDQGLYTIDLATFVFTRVFEFDGGFGVLTGLAVFIPGMDDVDVVPVPAAAFLFPLGAAGLAAARKRKAARA